jgi:hypothetical protein
MNKALMAARAAFRGQTAKIDKAGYDNSPFPEGTYNLIVKDSKIIDNKDGQPVHKMMLEIVGGDTAGRKVWPYSPNLTSVDGVLSMAKNVRAILGDVVPGNKTDDGQFEIALDAFLDEAEEFAAKLIGEVVEAKCVNSKVKADGSHLKDDGTPWQNWFINRGLGEDAKKAAAPKGTPRKNEVRPPTASMAVNKRKPIRK